MTKREAAIVSAYTRIFVGDVKEFQKYIEEILKRPVWTHELAYTEIWTEIKEAAKADFIALNDSITE